MRQNVTLWSQIRGKLDIYDNLHVAVACPRQESRGGKVTVHLWRGSSPGVQRFVTVGRPVPDGRFLAFVHGEVVVATRSNGGFNLTAFFQRSRRLLRQKCAPALTCSAIGMGAVLVLPLQGQRS